MDPFGLVGLHAAAMGKPQEPHRLSDRQVSAHLVELLARSEEYLALASVASGEEESTTTRLNQLLTLLGGMDSLTRSRFELLHGLSHGPRGCDGGIAQPGSKLARQQLSLSGRSAILTGVAVRTYLRGRPRRALGRDVNMATDTRGRLTDLFGTLDGPQRWPKPAY